MSSGEQPGSGMVPHDLLSYRRHLEDSDKSLSTPVLEFLPLGPYTDMLGCSISRFSIGLGSTLSSD